MGLAIHQYQIFGARLFMEIFGDFLSHHVVSVDMDQFRRKSCHFCLVSRMIHATYCRIDIMGNLIYLMAANSKRKGYKWAVPMAKIFWLWRVLSAYALLITVTMYAATDIEFGMQALDNEAFDTRYKQTFGHPAGLVLFIYSWAATPLWQWIGAVVIFDYKNLASVGRDVDTLVED
eukprot:729762_1